MNKLISILFWIALAVFLIIGFFFWAMHKGVNQDPEHVWQNSKPGDLLYINDDAMQDTNKNAAIVFWRAIRPMTWKEIEKLHVSEREKIKLKKEIDTNARREAIFTSYQITLENAFKHHNAYVGKLVQKDSTLYSTFFDNFFIVKPNFKLITKRPPDDIPRGYVVANNYYYLGAPELSLHQYKSFEKKK